MSEFYDRKGARLSLEEWHELRQIDKYRVLKQDTVNGVMVSTVWTGLDPWAGLGGRVPLIFETMVREGNSEERWVYGTEAEALAGHQKALKEVAHENQAGPQPG